MSGDVQLRPTTGPGEYPWLFGVWRTAVDATHDFLADEHRAAIEDRLATE
ncbi:hypothetical protein [Microbacterium halotolerans]|nr:hypothetical protein [Microbacterium halotolerans]